MEMLVLPYLIIGALFWIFYIFEGGSLKVKHLLFMIFFLPVSVFLIISVVVISSIVYFIEFIWNLEFLNKEIC